MGFSAVEPRSRQPNAKMQRQMVTHETIKTPESTPKKRQRDPDVVEVDSLLVPRRRRKIVEFA
jgi:hypothetical protein